MDTEEEKEPDFSVIFVLFRDDHSCFNTWSLLPHRVLCEQSQGLILLTTCRFQLPPSFSQYFYESLI